LYCYCVALLLFVLSYVLIVCTVPLPPGVNPIAVDKYINMQIKYKFKKCQMVTYLQEVREESRRVGTVMLLSRSHFPITAMLNTTFHLACIHDTSCQVST